ncbi:MAG: hypothetical protein F4Z84_02610, partial [Gammaproteobacteria bacterium]|nr:hypothetical protein [Gammaproteobacteria bacterium]
MANFDLTIGAGAADATGTFDLTPSPDALVEGNETLDVTGSTTDSLTVTKATLTLEDATAAPTVTLSVDADTGAAGVQDSLAENGGAKTVRVTATLGGSMRFAAARTVTVDVGKGKDSATEGTDYTTVGAQSLTINAGAARGHVDFTLTPTDDDIDEPEEAISIDGTLSGATVESTGLKLTDNEATPTVDLALTPATINESGNGNASTVTATLSGKSSEGVTVTVTVPAAAPVTLSSNAVLSIAAGATDSTGAVTITAVNNDVDALDKEVTVSGTARGGGVAHPEDQTLTINDDDDAPGGITLSVDTNGTDAGAPSTVGEGAGATQVTVTATVNGDTRYAAAKTVTVRVADGTATAPADYGTVANFNLTIGAGAASASGAFTVTPVDDGLDEPAETIAVTGSTADSLTVTGAAVSITDNDAAPVFSVAGGTADEGDAVTFTVSRAGAPANAVTVNIATAADSGDGVNAAGAGDFTAITPARTLTFASGDTSKTVTVQTTEDDLHEPDETFLAVLSGAAKAAGDPATGVSIAADGGSAKGTIEDDDAQPAFSIANADAAEGDDITFTVTRSGAADNAVSVQWNTKAATGTNAAAAADYTPVTSAQTLRFAAGEKTKTFTVSTTEDVLDEPDETFLVALSGAVGATITTAEATGTINDDDATPTGITLSLDPATVGEADGKTEITVTATVNGDTRYAAAKTVTVAVGGGASTAVAGTDYTAVDSFDITIDAGSASNTGTFELSPTGNTLDEADKSIDVTGATADGLDVAKATLTLTDNDDPVSFSITAASAADEGDPIQFTVTRHGAISNEATVQYTTAMDTSDGASAATADDYQSITTPITMTFGFNVGSMGLRLRTTEDKLHEPDETFLVALSNPMLADGDPGTGVSIVADEGSGTGTIRDDDSAPTNLTLSVDTDPDTDGDQASVEEDDGAQTVRVTATLGGSTRFATARTVTVDVGKSMDSATEGTDYTTVAQQEIEIAAGEASGHVDFTLTPTDDSLAEGSETISLDGTLADVTVTGASITLTDDDATPTGITLSLAPATVGEADGKTEITVTAT